MRFKTNKKVQPELVAGKDKYRPVLTTVHLDADKSQVVVTDSYMLARFPVELDEGDTSGPVPVDALKASRKTPLDFGKHKQSAKILLGKEKAEVVMDGKGAQDSTPYFECERGDADYHFPNVDQFVPENLATFRIGLNADKLARLAKAMGCGPNDAVELRFTMGSDGEPSPLRPILVRPSIYDETTPNGLLMPVRIP